MGALKDASNLTRGRQASRFPPRCAASTPGRTAAFSGRWRPSPSSGAAEADRTYGGIRHRGAGFRRRPERSSGSGNGRRQRPGAPARCGQPEGAHRALVLAGRGASSSGLAPTCAGGKNYGARWSGAEWLSRSAQVAELALTGELVAPDGDRYGACRLRAALFAGCPYVRVLFTITNQRPEKTFSAEAYGLKLGVPGSKPGPAGEGWTAVDAGGIALTVGWHAGSRTSGPTVSRWRPRGSTCSARLATPAWPPTTRTWARRRRRRSGWP